MLELKVADYCHGCPYLEPVKESEDYHTMDYYRMASNTYIVCKNDEKCRHIAEYLEKKLAEPHVKGVE